MDTSSATFKHLRALLEMKHFLDALLMPFYSFKFHRVTVASQRIKKGSLPRLNSSPDLPDRDKEEIWAREASDTKMLPKQYHPAEADRYLLLAIQGLEW